MSAALSISVNVKLGEAEHKYRFHHPNGTYPKTSSAEIHTHTHTRTTHTHIQRDTHTHTHTHTNIPRSSAQDQIYAKRAKDNIAIVSWQSQTEYICHVHLLCIAAMCRCESVSRHPSF